MEHDVWFTRVQGHLWFAWAEPGEPPHNFPKPVKSVREAFKWLRGAGIKIGQVGIADNEMLGLEHYS